MSELNLTHSNGYKVKLTTPDTLAANKTFKLPGADGSSGQFLKTDGSGALSFATPTSITTASGTMTIRIENNANGDSNTGVQSTTVVTGRYCQVGDMVHCSFNTGNIQKPGNIGGGLTLFTGCFPVTRDSNWIMLGSAIGTNVDSDVNGGSEVLIPSYGYWRNNTSLYFRAHRSNTTPDNVAWNMFPSNGTGKIEAQYSYKAA